MSLFLSWSISNHFQVILVGGFTIGVRPSCHRAVCSTLDHWLKNVVLDGFEMRILFTLAGNVRVKPMLTRMKRMKAKSFLPNWWSYSLWENL